MDGKESDSGSDSGIPIRGLDDLFKERRTLNKFLETKNPFDNDKITRVYQKIFRFLIEDISTLESRGITRGYLQPHQIMVAGGPDFEFMNVWLLNRPEEDNPTAPTYREQFDSLARMILGKRDAPNLESDNFLHITASAASGEQRLFDFKQLQWHPLLLPSTAKPKLVYHVYSYLGLEETLSWKKDFRQMIQRDVEVRDTVLGVDVDYFSHVYNLKGPQYYEENALGAFLFSANAILDTSYYIGKAFKEYLKDKENLKEPMTGEQIFDMLISFFPHVLIDVYDFLVKKGISIEKFSEDFCYF